MLRIVFVVAATLVAFVQAGGGASAQSYPQRTVKFILPFGPASGADITARLVGDRLAARWGRPVVIENRPGGDGLVAINSFIAANDDHTLLWVPVGTFAVHPFAHDKVPYDADRDLLPIANVSFAHPVGDNPRFDEAHHVARIRRTGPRRARQVQRRRCARQFRFLVVRLPQEREPGHRQSPVSRHRAGARRPRRRAASNC